MKRGILIVIAVVCSLLSHAQSGTIKVLDGKVIDGDFFLQKIFFFDDFTNGRIRLSDGTVYEGKLNVNTMTQSVRVITDTGDTISIKTEKMVETISTGNSFFFKMNGFYIQVINTDGLTSLGISRVMKIGQERIEGAYGGSNEVSSIAKLSSVDVENRLEMIKGSSNIKYDYVEKLYLIKDGKLLPVTKKNLQKFYPKMRASIDNYITENNTKFNNNESVINLYSFIVNNK